MTARLTTRVLSEFAELDARSGDWTQLQLGNGRPEIFQHLEWIRAWWQSFGAGYRLCTPVVLDQGRPAAILPLVRDGGRLSYLGHSVADYCHFFAQPAAGAQMLEECLEALRERSGWSEIRLDNVPDTSTLAAAIADLPPRWQRWVVRTPGEPCPTLLLDEDKEQRLAALLAKDKLKKTVKNLGKRGTLSFRHIEDAAQFEHHFAEFLRQHIRRSAIAGRRSVFLRDDYVMFYRDLVRRFGLQAQIRFCVLELNERPIAYHFGAQYAHKYLFYKPTFDVDLWDLSAGQALLWYLFDYCRTADVDEFDFGQGGEAYKYRFSNQVRQSSGYTIYAPALRSRIRRGWRAGVQGAKAKVRDSGQLAQRVSTLREEGHRAKLAFERAGVMGALRTVFTNLNAAGQERWLLSVDTAVTDTRAASALLLREAALATLADQAVLTPEFLSESQLLESRKRLTQGKKAWLAVHENTCRAVLWTCIDTKLTCGEDVHELAQKSLLAFDIWPLTETWSSGDSLALIAAARSTARTAALPLVALCPLAWLPSEQALASAGMKPVRRIAATRVEQTAAAQQQLN